MQQCWLNSETVMVEAWNSDSRTVWVEQCGGTVLVEQWDPKLARKCESRYSFP